MTRPTLFVSIDGPVLVPGKNPDSFLEAEIAPYAKPFMHWAAQHFDVHWLTDRNARDAFYLSKRLSLPEDKVSVSSFEDSKADVLAHYPDFYLVDTELIPHEVSWLSQHGNTHRVIQVDPMRGITPEHKTVLEEKLRKR